MKKRARHYDGKGNELWLDEAEGERIRITIVNNHVNPSAIIITEDDLLNLLDNYEGTETAGKHVNHHA